MSENQEENQPLPVKPQPPNLNNQMVLPECYDQMNQWADQAANTHVSAYPDMSEVLNAYNSS